MSGIEVVGLVLGVIPLVISGLEQYQNGLDTISSMRQYREIIADLILTFETAAARYHRVCESLFAELSFADADYADILDQPGGEQWRKEDIILHARDRLGSSLNPFVRLAQRIHKALLKFATRLELSPTTDLQPDWTQKNTPKQAAMRQRVFNKSHRIWRSIALGLDNGSLNKALKMIEDDIFRLERILEVGSQPATATSTRRKRSSTKTWHKTRDSARGLFEALTNHWQCSCKKDHAISLRLEPQQLKETGVHTARFNLIFEFNPVSEKHVDAPWKWRAIEIVSSESDFDHSAHPSIAPSASKPGISLSFIALNDTRPALPILPKVDDPLIITSKIRDLCDAMQSKAAKNSCMGILEDAAWKHQLYLVEQAQPNMVEDTRLTLHACLSQGMTMPKANGVSFMVLSPKQKYRLALILATAVLQLADTPWLDTDLNAQDIYLLDVCSDVSSPFSVQPYLQTKVVQTLAAPTANVPSLPLVANQRIFSLGIVLLELAFGQCLASFKTSTDVDAHGNDTPYTYHMIASRLLQPLALLECEKYADATKRCLMGSFSSVGGNLDDPTFQDQFNAGVITPLREIYEVLQ